MPVPLVIEHFDVIDQLQIGVAVTRELVASSLFTVEKLSMTALSWQLPQRLMLRGHPGQTVLAGVRTALIGVVQERASSGIVDHIFVSIHIGITAAAHPRRPLADVSNHLFTPAAAVGCSRC